MTAQLTSTGIDPGALPDSPLALTELADAVIAKLAAMPLSRAGDAEVLAAVETLERAWRRSAAANTALLVEVSDRDLFTRTGHTTVKRFYAQHLRLGHGEAKRRLITAESIGVFTAMTGDKLPPKREPLAAAAAEGTISAEHVIEVESILAKIPRSTSPDEVDTATTILAGSAAEMAPADLRPLGQRLLAHLDPDGTLADDTDRQLRRGITIGRQDGQLMSKISGYLTPALRAKLEVLLDNWAAPGMNNPDDPETHTGSKADLTDADRTSLAESARRDSRLPAQRNHDALERGLDWILGHQALGRPHRLPAELVITIDEADLARRAGVALTATGTMIPTSDLISLAADATPHLEVFKTHTRTVLDFARSKRIATKAQRLALFGAHHGCTRPGCTEPFSRTQAHHAAQDWALGGKTDVNDLTPACGPDNRNVGTRPGQWETAPIPAGPREGRTGWRLTGSDHPYRTNPLNHPRAAQCPAPPDSGRTGPTRTPRPTMYRTRPHHRPPPESPVETALTRLLVDIA
ncbi:HNH endonuclease signature motif containing protein [Gordonia crocea]|uniref:DUF222 domain-containing protein n=1 Tax=Gordonia crocea TaxID=589162 RepID=A0A7I9V057_9ACTN|nr:HNH endonuclease signature motif containing protein [Gordonia crocea]GED98817.1 hypothetical protein nbrc107697_28560 [Gordonia crocea]